MNLLIILLATAVLIGGYVLLIYNRFMTMRVRIKASIQEIGNQLKRQAELIPNLESAAKGYLEHEKGIFKRLTEAREAVARAQKSGSLEDTQKAEDLISQILPRIQVLVESNPEIKGADVVTQLMNELRDTSDKVMFSRRTLIDLVADYNTARVTLPSNLVAGMFGFPEEQGLVTPAKGEHLEVTAEQTKTPEVKL